MTKRVGQYTNSEYWTFGVIRGAAAVVRRLSLMSHVVARVDCRVVLLLLHLLLLLFAARQLATVS